VGGLENLEDPRRPLESGRPWEALGGLQSIFGGKILSGGGIIAP